MSGRIERVGAEIGVFIPSESCLMAQKLIETALQLITRESAGGWYPSTEVVELLAVLRRAPIIADTPRTEPGPRDQVGSHHGDRRTAAEVAQRLGVKPRQVGKLVNSGELAGRRTSAGWLIDPASVDALIERRRRAS